MLCGFCRAFKKPCKFPRGDSHMGMLLQPRSLQQCLAGEQTSVTEYRERMVAVRDHALTSCFIRHLPSSVSSALAGGVTSVAIASSSAEQRLHCEHGLPRTEGGHREAVRTKMGARRQHTESVSWHSLPRTSLFKQKAPTLCGAGRAYNWLPFSSWETVLIPLCSSDHFSEP